MHFLTPILLKSLAKRLPDTGARNIPLSIQGIPPGYPHRPGGHYTENGQRFSPFWSGESEPHVDSFRCYTEAISSDVGEWAQVYKDSFSSADFPRYLL
jgi:hypothetical protein